MSRKFLKHVEDNFLIQVLREMTRKGALLDLLVVNRYGLTGEVMIGGCLGHSGHEMVEFKFFGDRRKLSAELLHWILGKQTLGCSRN